MKRKSKQKKIINLLEVARANNCSKSQETYTVNFGFRVFKNNQKNITCDIIETKRLNKLDEQILKGKTSLFITSAVPSLIEVIFFGFFYCFRNQ